MKFIEKLHPHNGSLLCVDRDAKINFISLIHPNERPHFAPLYPPMEITGTPERVRMEDLEQRRLVSARKTNKKRIHASPVKPEREDWSNA